MAIKGTIGSLGRAIDAGGETVAGAERKLGPKAKSAVHMADRLVAKATKGSVLGGLPSTQDVRREVRSMADELEERARLLTLRSGEDRRWQMGRVAIVAFGLAAAGLALTAFVLYPRRRHGIAGVIDDVQEQAAGAVHAARDKLLEAAAKMRGANG